MLRYVRLEGSSISSGKDSTFSSSPIKNTEREVSVCKPHCMRPAMSLLQLRIQRKCNVEGKPPSGHNSTSEQPNIPKKSRDGRREGILSGNCFKFLQCRNVSSVKTGAGNPPLGNETNLGHCSISKEWREIYLAHISQVCLLCVAGHECHHAM